MAAIHGPATLRFLGVLAFTAVWLGVVYAVPDIGAVTNRVGVFRIAIHLVILAGLWFALEHTAFEPDVRLRVWLLIAIPLTLWLAGIWTLAGRRFLATPSPVVR